MLFDSDQRSGGYRRKRINWVTPRTLGVLLLFFALVFMLFYAVRDENSYSTPFERIIFSPVSAIWKIHTATTGFFTDLSENFHAKDELDRVQIQLEALQRENGQLMYRLRLFEAFREALALPLEEDLPTLPAIVITHDQRMTRSFIVNRGSLDGVKANMAVWNGKGLIGRTTPSLTEHRAKIQPVTDPRSAIGVYVLNTEFEGILRGTEDGDSLLLTDLHQVGFQNAISRPEPGQSVYTSGMGLVFPRNLLAGVIAESTSESGIVVKPAVDLGNVESVLIIMNNELRDETVQLLTEE